MSVSLPELVERKRQIVTEISEKHHELMTIDHLIETEALRLASIEGGDKCPNFSIFKDETKRLLTAFWGAFNKTLSQEDIRQDVILDEEASDGAVRHVINRAKKALRNVNSPYDIKNVRGKGYSLVNAELFQSVPKQANTLKNTGEKRRKR